MIIWYIWWIYHIQQCCHVPWSQIWQKHEYHFYVLYIKCIIVCLHFLYTAKAMESLNIPKGVRRVLFRTLNTDRYVLFSGHIFMHNIHTFSHSAGSVFRTSGPLSICSFSAFLFCIFTIQISLVHLYNQLNCKQMICRKLMWKKGGDLSYVGFTEDGAQWLVDNTDIKLVGM